MRVVSLSDGGRLIAPRHPSFARTAREQFEKWSRAARLDDFIQLVRLARVFTLARGQQIYLPPSRCERAGVRTTHAEQDKLGYVAEIEADTAAIRTAVRADFVPDDVGLVGKAPRLHQREALGQQRVRAPQIEVRSRRRDCRDRQRLNLL